MIISVLLFAFTFSIGFLRRKGLRVLMYHNITDKKTGDRLNVTSEQFTQHLIYLHKKGYTSISLSQLLDPDYRPKDKTYLLTFDDGYKNNLYNMYPILQKFNAKCAIFLVSGFISRGTANSAYMNLNELKSFDPNIVEFGLHSYDHKSYAEMSCEEINIDLKNSKKFFEAGGIKILPAFAYPYGAYPKKNKTLRTKIFSAFKKENIVVAFRIGNRINRLPLSNKYLIQRLDITGNDSLSKFARKVRIGRLLFS